MTDSKQCEAMITYANPFTMGGTGSTTERCEKAATVFVLDIAIDMAICDSCEKEFIRLNGNDFVIERIEGSHD